MPTKIILEKSNPQKGLINQNDLHRIMHDFENFAEIDSAIAREFKKINIVSVPALLIKHMLEIAQEQDPGLSKSRINIHFGITLPGQKDCLDDHKDVSNHLTTVFVTEINNVEQDQPGDYVIAPGFKEFFENGGGKDRACCPVIHPGGGS